MPDEDKKSHYLFKITIVGPDDALVHKVMNTINENIVTVDGIQIGTTEVDAGKSEVRAVVMSPTRKAMDILLSLTYRGATAAMIVLKEPDPAVETKFRNLIREEIGAGYPTRVFYAGKDLDEPKRQELAHLFNSLIEEMLAARERE